MTPNFERTNETRDIKTINGLNYYIDPECGPKLSSIEQLYESIEDKNIVEQISPIFKKYEGRKRDIVEISPDQFEFEISPTDGQKRQAWDILVLTYQDYILGSESKEAGRSPQIIVIKIKGAEDIAGVVYKINDPVVIDSLRGGIEKGGGNTESLSNENTVAVDFLAINPFLERGHMYDIEKGIINTFRDLGYEYLISETAVLNLHEMYKKMGFELFINEDVKNKGLELLSKINSANPIDLAKIEIPKEYELLFRYDNLPKVPTQTVLLSESAYLLKKL